MLFVLLHIPSSFHLLAFYQMIHLICKESVFTAVEVNQLSEMKKEGRRRSLYPLMALEFVTLVLEIIFHRVLQMS